MELPGLRRNKKRKRQRRNLDKKKSDQNKFEVRSFKHKKSTTEYNNLFMKKQLIVTMEANTFWENYKAAQDWQNRHNSTWWKARCFAVENENYLLKTTIENLINIQESHKNIIKTHEYNKHNNYRNMKCDLSNKDRKNVDDIFEFQLNEDMMSFLTQSIRHKIELKNKRSTKSLYQHENLGSKLINPNDTSVAHRRSNDAKLLYGEATSRILAMETALQATVEKHLDKLKPKYWPNIPLKF